MPVAVFKTVREVSSEDVIHTAQNLLKHQPGKKWKTENVGEKSAYFILELDKPQQIVGIDIGNEHAAFVEVLVGRAGCPHEDFKEILITCSFMTPIESKNSSNPNRVRCFSQDALVSTAAPSKWHSVKVICTQPFNRHVQYGLSFIKVHLAEDVSLVKKESSVLKSLVPDQFLKRNSAATELCNENTSKPSCFKSGKFMLREDSPDSESESSSALFNRWKMMRKGSAEGSSCTPAASIRQASSPSGLRCLSDISSKTKSVVSTSGSVPHKDSEEQPLLDRNREKLLFGDDDAAEEGPHHQSLSKHIEVDRGRLRLENKKVLKQKETRKSVDLSKTAANKQKPSISSGNTTLKLAGRFEQNKSERAEKRLSSPTRVPAKKIKSVETTQYRPFNELLRGVVLVISGIQNPDRADLRNKAIALGAKYKADWEQGCTHLICAFKNTPKYNQVKGKGKIITRSWIEKCYTLKKYLPWRRYALESAELTQPESDEEILDESLRPMLHENEEDMLTNKYDLEDSVGKRRNSDQLHNLTSGSDTEDEILRVNQKNHQASNNHKKEVSVDVILNKSTNRDIYDVTTEEEYFLNDKLEMISTVKTFFKQTQFCICADVSVVDKIKLEQFIEKYGGSLTQNLSQAQFAVSNKAVEKPENTNFTGETVLPLWIYECNDMELRVPITRYLV